jgi:hypothetical protein
MQANADSPDSCRLHVHGRASTIQSLLSEFVLPVLGVILIFCFKRAPFF